MCDFTSFLIGGKAVDTLKYLEGGPSYIGWNSYCETRMKLEDHKFELWNQPLKKVRLNTIEPQEVLLFSRPSYGGSYY
jgi:hypothetical protein